MRCTYTQTLTVSPSDIYGPCGWTKETLEYQLTTFQVKVVDFRIPDKNDLIIYNNIHCQNIYKHSDLIGFTSSTTSHPRLIVENLDTMSLTSIWE